MICTQQHFWGAAKLLKSHERELKGTVKLLFQSAEETFQGAKAAVDAGVLENPRVVRCICNACSTE